jgi:two-component system, cell cycle response regulator CpdR
MSILLAEDDRGLSSFIELVLHSNGYRVVARHNGNEALDELRNGEFSLVLADVMLPGLTGDLLAERARQLQPRLPVVFMTGAYGLPFLLSHDRVIRKPFTEEQLLEAVLATAGPPG